MVAFQLKHGWERKPFYANFANLRFATDVRPHKRDPVRKPANAGDLILNSQLKDKLGRTVLRSR